MKFLSLFIITSLFMTSAFASTEVDYSEFEVKVTLKALDYADPISSSNEYKIGVTLINAESRNNLGSLIGSTSENIHAPFSNYIRIKPGKTVTVKSKILLPTKTIDSVKLRVGAVEADFTLVIPGPCCLLVNDDDSVVYESFILETQTFSSISADGVTEVEISITKTSQGSMGLKVLREKQKEQFIEETGVRFFESKMANLYSLILDTI